MQSSSSEEFIRASFERTSRPPVRTLRAFRRVSKAMMSILAAPTSVVVPTARMLAAAAAATAVFGCVGNADQAKSLKDDLLNRQAPLKTSWEQAEVDYFPHRFPTPQGEIEPLPSQF